MRTPVHTLLNICLGSKMMSGWGQNDKGPVGTWDEQQSDGIERKAASGFPGRGDLWSVLWLAWWDRGVRGLYTNHSSLPLNPASLLPTQGWTLFWALVLFMVDINSFGLRASEQSSKEVLLEKHGNWGWECSTVSTERRDPSPCLGSPKEEELASSEEQGVGACAGRILDQLHHTLGNWVFSKGSAPLVKFNHFLECAKSVLSIATCFIHTISCNFYGNSDWEVIPIMNLSSFPVIKDTIPSSSIRLKQVGCALFQYSAFPSLLHRAAEKQLSPEGFCPIGLTREADRLSSSWGARHNHTDLFLFPKN